MNAEMDVGTNKKAFQINLDVEKLRNVRRDRRRTGSGTALFSCRRRGRNGRKNDVGLRHDSLATRFTALTDRYVSRTRLQTMLDHEYSLVDRTARQENRRRAHLLCFRRHGGGAQFQAAQRIARLAGGAFPSRARAVNRARSSSTSGCWMKRTSISRKRSASSA